MSRKQILRKWRKTPWCLADILHLESFKNIISGKYIDNNYQSNNKEQCLSQPSYQIIYQVFENKDSTMEIFIEQQ